MITYTESQLVDYIAEVFDPHSLQAEDIMWQYVCEENRSAPFEVKAKRFARIAARTAERRRRAQAWLATCPVVR